MIARRLPLVCVFAAASVFAQELTPLERGHRAFRNKDYVAAAEAFEQAGDGYWLGRAEFAIKRYPQAEAAFLRHLKTKDGGDVSSMIYLGRSRLELRKLALAIKALEKAYEKAPQDRSALYWYAVAVRRAGLPDKAIMPLTTLATLQPKKAGPRYDLGRTLYDADQFPAAAKAFGEACALAPKQASYRTWQGLALFKGGKHREASEAFRQSLRLDPRDSQSHYWFGRALLELGDNARAVEAFRAAVAGDKASPQPRLWLARAQVAADDRASAIRDLKGFASSSDDAALLAYYGRLLAEAGKPNLAAAALERAARSAPRDSSLLRDQAEAYLALGNVKDAQATLERATRVDASDLKAWRRLGALHAQAGRVVPARDAYEHLVRGIASPAAADLALFGQAELSARRPKSAVAVLRRAVEAYANETKPELLGELGVACYLAGDPVAAMTELSKAVKALPNNARLFDYLGRAYHRQARRADATRAFQRAVRPYAPHGEESDRPQPRRYLGRYALEEGRFEDATRWAESAVALAPNDASCRETAGRVALVRLDRAAAFAHFAAAAKLAPKRADLALLAGRSGVEAGEPAAGERLLRAALKGGGDEGEARLWLGRALLAQKRLAPAIGELTRAARLLPKRVEVWLSLGSAHIANGDPAQTVVALRRAKALQPENVGLCAPLVEALRAAEDAAGADELRREWLALAFPEIADQGRGGRERADDARRVASDPSVPRALQGELRLLRAELLDSSGDVDGAEAALAAAAKDAPWSYRVALTGGRLAEQSGSRGRALERYERAKRLAPTRSGPAVAVARLLLDMGDVAGSLAELKAAVAANPGASSPVVELIRLRALRLETERALETLAKAQKRLSEPALLELRSSQDFAALWQEARFRELIGDPLPGRLGRGGGERLLETGQSAYFSAGELTD